METMTELRVDTIDAKPVDFDWTEHQWGEDFEFWDAKVPEDGDTAECSECGFTITYRDAGGWDHDDPDDNDHEPAPDEEWEFRSESSEGPMMSYYYPVDIKDTIGAARTLAAHSLPLCVVEVNRETGLALTGGGMDLSWEICEAFMVLGYQPPAHFCRLPAMAGRGTSETDRRIIEACRRTLELVSSWAQRDIEHLEQL